MSEDWSHVLQLICQPDGMRYEGMKFGKTASFLLDTNYVRYYFLFSKKFYFYGKPGSEMMPNKNLLPVFVFLLFTSSFSLFSQNQKVDGYKGIWFSYGQPLEFGYKYSGGVATYTARHRPIAIYSPEVKKTFFVYGGTTASDEQHLLIMASYYDHRSHLVPKPVIVYDKMGVREPHDNSSLSIDGEGYL